MNKFELFNKLIKSSNIWDAHIVGKNLYNQNIDNKEFFERYFNFLVTVAGYPIEIETRNFFVNEAETALLFFSENVEIDEKILEFIKNSREKLMFASQKIKEVKDKNLEEYQEKVIKENDLNLSNLVELKGKLYDAESQENFDKLLIEVNNYENGLEKDFFTNEQENLYDALTKEFSQIISNKMNDLNQKDYVDYNKKAIRDFKYVFDKFKDNEAKYKEHHSHLYALVSKKLFSYDASKLFNETLIYYNHVYSYIFSKLDDNGKFRLTQISIDTEKIKG